MPPESRNPNLTTSEIAAPQVWQKASRGSLLSLCCPRPDTWWTGVPPRAGACPGVGDDGKLRSLPPLDLARCGRADVLAYFDNGWTLSETLFAGLVGEAAFYVPPYHSLRHPLIFYYGHPAVLYVNKLRIAGLVEEPIHPYFESLFETGVDEMSWDDMAKNVMEWPTVDEVHAYRRRVYKIVRHLIEHHPGLADGHPQISQDSPLWALFMGLEHERIHLETSSVLIRELPLSLVCRPPWFPGLHPSAAEPTSPHPHGTSDHARNAWLGIGCGTVALGKPEDWPTYGWDNEYGSREVAVEAFSVTQDLVSNGEFWEFVVGGGYQEARYWTDEGWSWRMFRNAKWPAFWAAHGPAGTHAYKLRTLFESIPMPWKWPAVVNCHEAEAYCRWRAETDGYKPGYRLPSEAEQARLDAASDLTRASRNHLTAPAPANLNLRWGSESPVDSEALRPGKPRDVYGNVWQWCEDDFNPLADFRVHRYYDDFSTPCFDGEHRMILGGSFISTGDEATPWARFHFRPHFFQHAGFRMVKATGAGRGGAVRLATVGHSPNPYESDTMLQEYLVLHYAPPAIQMPYEDGPRAATRFPERCAELVLDWTERLNLTGDRALDIGCAVGGSTFGLARRFGEVLGLDLSGSFIDAANRIAATGQVTGHCREEGELTTTFEATFAESLRRRVQFRRADACALPAELVDYDAVLIANVLCRLPSPKACIGRLAGPRGLVRRGGLLVLTTPFTWMESYTPKDVWLGGRSGGDGLPQWSEDGLKEALAPNFELLHQADMPFVIREHRRKFQYIVALATVWRRR